MGDHASGLIRFVQERGCLRGRVDDPSTLTHLLLDGTRGGRIVLPDHLTEEFYSALASDLSLGVAHCVVEKRSDVFRMHFDLDFDEVLDSDEILLYIETICASLREYYGFATEEASTPPAVPAVASTESLSTCTTLDPLETREQEVEPSPSKSTLPSPASSGIHANSISVGSADFTCVACAVLDDATSSPKMDKKGLRTRKAPGLHLIFPFLHVNQDQALWLRSGALHALKSLETSRTLDWNKIVDVAVLTSNGLRLIGNDKTKICPRMQELIRRPTILRGAMPTQRET